MDALDVVIIFGFMALMSAAALGVLLIGAACMIDAITNARRGKNGR